MTHSDLFLPAAPTTFTLELTADCNSACVGCGNVFSHSPAALSSEAWQTLLDRIAPYAVVLRLSGGEPTLHPEFDAVLRAVNALGKPFVLFTNGFWLDSEEVLEALCSCRNLDGILVSLHGPSAEIHGEFTGVDSFASVVGNIRQAVALGLRVSTNTVLTQAVFPYLEAMADFALGLGAWSAAFSRYYGPPLPGVELADDQLLEAAGRIATMHAADRRVRFNNSIPFCFSPTPTKQCPAGWSHATVDPWGRVRPCNHSAWILGDLGAEPITAIWQGEAAQRWRALVPEPCAGCEAFAHCRGGCKAQGLVRGNSHDPLIKGALTIARRPEPVERLVLPPTVRPVLSCTLIDEAWGFQLVNRNSRVSLAPAARKLVSALDGTTTLQDIQARWGERALNLVGLLYEKGLVELLSDS
jgi:radical SAM protein with 4Fe4S-binding SPASM domain